MGFLVTHTITLKQSDGTVRAQGLPVTMDPKALDNWQLQAQSTVPVYLFDVETIGWTTPLPAYSDYLVDQNGVRYSMFSQVFQGLNTLQFTVSKVSGTTP